MIKQCPKCKNSYPATNEYFCKDKNRLDNFGCWCKKCQKKYNKKYNQKPEVKMNQRKASLQYRKTLKGHLIDCFTSMKQRCNNSKNCNYKYYGGRGIKCLFESSAEFINYVINELQTDPRGLEIDRIDNDGNYEIGNIRFITHGENMKNKRKKYNV